MHKIPKFHLISWCRNFFILRFVFGKVYMSFLLTEFSKTAMYVVDFAFFTWDIKISKDYLKFTACKQICHELSFSNNFFTCIITIFSLISRSRTITFDISFGKVLQTSTTILTPFLIFF